MSAPVYGVQLRNQTPLLLVVTPTGTAMGRVVSLQLTGETTGANPTAKHPIVSRAMTVGSTYTTISPYIVNAMVPLTTFEGRHTYTTAPTIVTSPVSDYPYAVRNATTCKMSFARNSGVVFQTPGIAVYGSAASDFRWSADIHFEVL